MSTTPSTLNHRRARDAADTLRPLRDLFDIPEGVIYLDGNSLGVMPKTAAAPRCRSRHPGVGPRPDPLLEHRRLVQTCPQRLGNRIAPLIGADAR